MRAERNGLISHGTRAGSTTLIIVLAVSFCVVVPNRRSAGESEITITPRPGTPAAGEHVKGEPAAEAPLQPGPGAVPVFAHAVTADSVEGSSISMVDREWALRFQQAEQLERDNELGAALSTLQEVLDGPADGFFPNRYEDGAVRHGLRWSTERRISDIIQRDPKAYERLFGPVAKKLLDESIASGDIEQARSVLRRYFHTRAGKEATYRLAMHYLDHDQPFLAIACLKRMHNDFRGNKQRFATLAVQLSLCQFRAGRPEEAAATLEQLRSTGQMENLLIGDRKLTSLDAGQQPLEWLAQNFGISQPSEARRPSSVSLANVQPAVMISGDDAAPIRTASWAVSSLGEHRDDKPSNAENVDAVSQALFAPRRGDRSALVTSPSKPVPLIVGDTVIFRTPVCLSAVNGRTGELIWQSEFDETAAEYLPDKSRTQRIFTQLLEQRIWLDFTYGKVSSDGERVFCIDHVGMARAFKENRKSPFAFPNGSNRLVARDVKTGNLIWSRDGSDPRYSLGPGMTFWMGAPLLAGGQLYCLADHNRQVTLVSLDPQTGATLWSTVLAVAGADISYDYYRRLCGMSPIISDGLIIASTGTGSVVAVDSESQQLVWAHSPSDSFNTAERKGHASKIETRSKFNGMIDWFDDGLTLADGKLLVRPRGTDSIHCLDAATGTLAWKEPCDSYWYVAAADGGSVIFVGPSSACAFDLKTGKPAWKQPTAIRHPSGRGIVADGVLYVPMTSGEISSVRVATGQLISRRRPPGDAGVGNLVRWNDRIVSQNLRSVRVFPFFAAKVSDVAETGLPKITPGQQDVR